MSFEISFQTSSPRPVAHPPLSTSMVYYNGQTHTGGTYTYISSDDNNHIVEQRLWKVFGLNQEKQAASKLWVLGKYQLASRAAVSVPCNSNTWIASEFAEEEIDSDPDPEFFDKKQLFGPNEAKIRSIFLFSASAKNTMNQNSSFLQFSCNIPKLLLVFYQLHSYGMVRNLSLNHMCSRFLLTSYMQNITVLINIRYVHVSFFQEILVAKSTQRLHLASYI